MSSYIDRRDEKIKTLIITPSLVSDIAVNCISEKQITRDYETAAYAAARFLYNVRGLPSDSIEIETSEKIYSVTRNAKNKKTAILLPKCKVICANKAENVGVVDLNVSVFSYKNRIFKITKCARAEHFADSSLRALLRSGIGDSIDGVAAYSCFDGEVYARYLLAKSDSVSDALYLLLSVATAVFEKASVTDELKVKSDGFELSVNRCGEMLSVSDEKCDIYTLGMPDNNLN